MWRITSSSSDRWVPCLFEIHWGSKFPSPILGTQIFITLFIITRHLAVSWASWPRPKLSLSIYLTYILISSSRLSLVFKIISFLTDVPTKYMFLFLFSPLLASSPVHLTRHLIIIIIIVIYLSWSWPLVDPFRSHVSGSLFKGLPWFLLSVGE